LFRFLKNLPLRFRDQHLIVKIQIPDFNYSRYFKKIIDPRPASASRALLRLLPSYWA